MDAVQVAKRDLIRSSQSNKAVLESLIRANALNRSGNINYNENGNLDGIGFEKVSEKFVDSFILKLLVPDYNTKKIKGKHITNIFVGSQNRTIRELLEANGLEKCNVKAVVFSESLFPNEKMIKNMPNRNEEKQAERYYIQEFKVACPNKDYSTVMNFLRSVDYNGYGIFLKDVDVTIDYSGSFDKYECINHLLVSENFRVQGSFENQEEYPRTIVNNDAYVGKNCLTWMEDVDGITTRQKVYNKMVQMLEIQSVRSTVGCHWKDWVCQTDTRLATARDKAKERGLTRAEVTIYIEDKIPDDGFIDKIVEKITEYIPKKLVYSTAYKKIWESYCNSFKHSLVCIDRSQDIGIIVYSYNEITQNISGQVIENWNQKEKWCLDKLTLNGTLPLDILEVTEVAKVFEKDKKDILLEIIENRYYKVNKDETTRFTTRLVNKQGAYTSTRGKENENDKLLEKAGFLPHENCIPYLAKYKSRGGPKADAKLRKIGALEVHLHFCRENKKQQEEKNKEKFNKEFNEIEEKTKTLLLEIKAEKELKQKSDEIKLKFGNVQNKVKLVDLKQGIYTVIAAKKIKNSMYGKQCLLLMELDGEKQPALVWSNKIILESLLDAENEDNLDLAGDYLYLPNGNLGSLTISGQAYDFRGHRTVYCNLSINKRQNDKPSESAKEVEKTETKATTLITRENLLTYHEYPNLATLPIESVHNVVGYGFINNYGRDRLFVSLDGKIYQAGENLEKNVEQLKDICKIKIERTRTNSSTKQKYAVCIIYEKNDWTALLDYAKLKILPKNKMDGETCIMDVRTVNIKGKKRKLLLTDRGDGPIVYKLKKSKLEDSIKVGFI